MKERVFVFTFTQLVVPSLEESVLFRETNVNISLKYVLPFGKVNTDRPLMCFLDFTIFDILVSTNTLDNVSLLMLAQSNLFELKYLHAANGLVYFTGRRLKVDSVSLNTINSLC